MFLFTLWNSTSINAEPQSHSSSLTETRCASLKKCTITLHLEGLPNKQRYFSPNEGHEPYRNEILTEWRTWRSILISSSKIGLKYHGHSSNLAGNHVGLRYYTPNVRNVGTKNQGLYLAVIKISKPFDILFCNYHIDEDEKLDVLEWGEGSRVY